MPALDVGNLKGSIMKIINLKNNRDNGVFVIKNNIPTAMLEVTTKQWWLWSDIVAPIVQALKSNQGTFVKIDGLVRFIARPKNIRVARSYNTGVNPTSKYYGDLIAKGEHILICAPHLSGGMNFVK